MCLKAASLYVDAIAVGVFGVAGVVLTEGKYRYAGGDRGIVQNLLSRTEPQQTAGQTVQNGRYLALALTAVHQRNIQPFGQGGVQPHGGTGPGGLHIGPAADEI